MCVCVCVLVCLYLPDISRKFDKAIVLFSEDCTRITFLKNQFNASNLFFSFLFLFYFWYRDFTPLHKGKKINLTRRIQLH